jgi:hypothetical protein
MRHAFQTQQLSQQPILRNLVITMVIALVWMVAVAATH